MSDAELVLAARRGDKRAFVEIVARHQAMVCGIALGILADFAASEDAGQEAFLTAWRKIHELREPERLRAWLGQIARNAALGQLRRRRGHEALDEALVVADHAPTPDEAAASEEEAALVRQSLLKLPENYRLPLILYYREGKSVRAVAEALGVSEDAVKQRLSRGREMLQERMSGLIENVLSNTKPTAIFTMAIAVAIGALVAPSAMAASAFTAATAAGASTVPVTNTLFTAMSTSKGILVATAIVAIACIPLGYQIRTGKEHSVQNPVSIPAPEIAPVKHEATADFGKSVLFAEWRDLHARYGTNGAAMPVLYKAIGDLKDPFRKQVFRTALIAEWAEVDPAGGMRFFLGKGPDASQRRMFFEEWIARDAKGAMDALLANESGWDKFPLDCLPQLARIAPSHLPDIVSRLPVPESYWDTNVRDAFAILAQGDLSASMKAAEAVTGPNRIQALSGVARAWAKNDLSGAIAWAKSLPEGTDRDEVIRGALIGKAAVDPAAALDSVGLVPPGGRYAYFATTTGARVLEAGANSDFDATVAWVAAHPGRLSRQDLDGLAHPVTEKLNADAAQFLSAHAADGSLAALVPAINSALLNKSAGQREAVWEWLKTQPETETTLSIKKEVLSSAAWQEPELAMKLVNDLPRTKEGDAEVTELARCLFNGGNMLGRFEGLVGQVPERLHEPLVEQAFACLSGEYLDDPQKWITRLSMLPNASRPKAIESLGQAWAQQTPEEAVGWIASLAPGDSQNAAAAGVASAWARKDAQGAADWVASLPQGPERDRSAQSLVTAVADQFPREAWDWATSIGDATERKDAAIRAAKALAARDPATARQLIEAGPFTTEARAEIEAALQKPGPSKGRL